MSPRPGARLRTLAALLGLTSLSGCLGPWPGLDALVVSEPILTDTVWSADTPVVLDGLIYVESNATLTIEPGTTIRGRAGSALIVTRDAFLSARGRPEAPIVFTSDREPGTRAPGDWGGVVMLGNAPVNRDDAIIEGIDPGESRGRYGGNDVEGSCGVLEYARIEFAGFTAFQGSELNSLTLGGCGRGTVVEHVQVHMGEDDGVEMFGGAADLRHILITRPGDDGLDWDLGWTGRAQFVIVQLDPDVGEHAIEADNNEDDFSALPVSDPTLFNLTLVGSGNDLIDQRGMLFRRGTRGVLRNLIVTSMPTEILDIRDFETAAYAQTDLLEVSYVIAYDIGESGTRYFESEVGDDDDDNGLNESQWLTGFDSDARLGTDPGLPDAAYDLLDPDFVPVSDSPAGEDATDLPQDDFWDEAADYVGAVRPGTAVPWYDGWSAFPAD